MRGGKRRVLVFIGREKNGQRNGDNEWGAEREERGERRKDSRIYL